MASAPLTVIHIRLALSKIHSLLGAVYSPAPKAVIALVNIGSRKDCALLTCLLVVKFVILVLSPL